MDRNQTASLVRQMMDSGRFSSARLIPQAILVVKDTAVVFYSYQLDETSPMNRITHTWKRLDNQWKMIGGMSTGN